MIDILELQKRREAFNQGYWVVPEGLDTTDFDFDWRPSPVDRPYIHQFGTQWQRTGGPQYIVPGYEGIKFHIHQKAVRLPDKSAFTIAVDKQVEFDWSWHPDDTEPAFIWTFGNQYYTAEEMPTIEFHVQGATQRKYVNDVKAKLVTDPAWWYISDPDVEPGDVMSNWTPHPHDPPFIYAWGNKWTPAEVKPSIEYRVPSATQYKYVDNNLPLKPQWDRWKILKEVDRSSFDFTWRPSPGEPPYVYVWGNQWLSAEEMPTVEYHTPGATDRKYMGDCIAKLANNKEWFIEYCAIDKDKFDYSWTPHPYDPPYIYAWGNKWIPAEVKSTVEYRVPGATEYKYMPELVDLMPLWENWHIEPDVDKSTFDFTWRPNPGEPPYIYAWGNKWVAAEVLPSIEYNVSGATEYKYMPELVEVKPQLDRWTQSVAGDWSDFDFTWRPNPLSPPQIYQWEDGGPTYTTPGATEIVLMKFDNALKRKSIPRYYITTTLNDLVEQHPDEVFWALNPDLKYDSFDFNWRPDELNFRHINVFGNELSKDTQTYYVNAPMYRLGYREYNYVSNAIVEVDTNLAMFYVDCGLDDCTARYEELKTRYPQLQRTRYLNSWIETIGRCVRKSSTRLTWILSSDLDYTDFDFDFYPASWQMGMTHVFGTQWSHWGNTYLVNTAKFQEDSKYLGAVEHLKNINHVRGKKAKTLLCRHDILYIQHPGIDNASNQSILHSTRRKIYVTEYCGSYLQTLKNFFQENITMAEKPDFHLWITSNICDYTGFDFTWRGDPFQNDQIHAFSSKFGKSRQKFGDTFLLNVAKFCSEANVLDALEDYTGKVNYVEHIAVQRQQHPTIVHNHDSQVDAVLELQISSWPYYELVNSGQDKTADLVPSVWVAGTQPVVVGSKGAGQIIVPHCALGEIRDEVYDWPHIEEAKNIVESKPIDIIFITNGESGSEENWNHLNSVVSTAKTGNRIIWIKDISGRVASQRAAAEASRTDWYFLVNAKLRVDESFSWTWQPDRLQQRKHYIFYAKNPVNGLVYGHQAIVANNKWLTLNTVPRGLDFTMDSLHAVQNILSGVANYNIDEWTTWRTAFREAIKLKSVGDRISLNRLEAWCSPGSGNYANISQAGAIEGVAYWNSVSGNLNDLMLTYDWDWIYKYYKNKYG